MWFVMIVDYPFFFAISEQESRALLFAGVVIDPTFDRRCAMMSDKRDGVV